MKRNMVRVGKFEYNGATFNHGELLTNIKFKGKYITFLIDGLLYKLPKEIYKELVKD